MKHIIDDFSAEEAAQPRRVQVFDAVDDDRLFRAEKMRDVRDRPQIGRGELDDLISAMRWLVLLIAIPAAMGMLGSLVMALVWAVEAAGWQG